MNIYANSICGVMLVSLLGACATPVGEAVSNAGNTALQLVGLGSSDGTPKGTKQVSVQLWAGEKVNSDKAGRGFAVVARLYPLKASEIFTQLPREVFDVPSQIPEALKQDALASREQILVPGQHYQLPLALPPETRFLGIVLMFQSKEPARWRAVLPVTALASSSPIVVGVHRCSFTVTEGVKDKDLQAELALVGSANCN